MREAGRWTLLAGAAAAATTGVILTADTAWRLLFNALSEADATKVIRVEGRAALAAPLLTARSVVV